MSEAPTARKQVAPSSASWPGESSGGAERVLLGLLLVALAILAAMVFLAALGVLRLADTLPFGRELERVLLFQMLPAGVGRPLAAVVSGAVGLLSVLVLLRRLTGGSSRPEARHVLVADERGFVMVEKRGIATVASSALKRIPGIIDANVQVIGGGAAPVRLAIRVWIHAGAKLAEVGDEARKKATEAVENLVGLDVHDVLVRVEVVPLEELDRLIK